LENDSGLVTATPTHKAKAAVELLKTFSCFETSTAALVLQHLLCPATTVATMLARSSARVLAAAQPQASSAVAALYATGRDPSLGDQMKETVCELVL
jgi:hypothetical protein